MLWERYHKSKTSCVLTLAQDHIVLPAILTGKFIAHLAVEWQSNFNKVKAGRLTVCIVLGIFGSSMRNIHTALTGRCLCGSLQYRIEGPVGKPHACHCGQYLQQRGHYAVSADVQRTYFSTTQDSGLKWYESSSFARRGFCKECGSALL